MLCLEVGEFLVLLVLILPVLSTASMDAVVAGAADAFIFAATATATATATSAVVAVVAGDQHQQQWHNNTGSGSSFCRYCGCCSAAVSADAVFLGSDGAHDQK